MVVTIVPTGAARLVEPVVVGAVADVALGAVVLVVVEVLVLAAVDGPWLSVAERVLAVVVVALLGGVVVSVWLVVVGPPRGSSALTGKGSWNATAMIRPPAIV